MGGVDLPDEAVEAMARWIAAHDGFSYDHLPVPEEAEPRYQANYREVAAQALRGAVAALPAGVYVSDGKGNVTPPDESVAAAALFEFAREDCGWGSHEWDLCQQMAGVVLAALSAADTEGADRAAG